MIISQTRRLARDFFSRSLRGSNTLLWHLDVLEPFKRKKQVNEIRRRIIASLLHDRRQRIGDSRVENDTFNHQAGQVHANALIHCECHDFTLEFDAPGDGMQLVADRTIT